MDVDAIGSVGKKPSRPWGDRAIMDIDTIGKLSQQQPCRNLINLNPFYPKILRSRGLHKWGHREVVWVSGEFLLQRGELDAPRRSCVSSWRRRFESALPASGWQGARRVEVRWRISTLARHAPCWPAARQRSRAALERPRAPAPFSSTGCGSYLMPMCRQGFVPVLTESRFGRVGA
jgi:hypothetical protein